MALLVPSTGQGDAAVTEILTPEMEAMRQELRRRLIAARGSTYTYRNPTDVASRSVSINMGGSGAGSSPNEPGDSGAGGLGGGNGTDGGGTPIDTSGAGGGGANPFLQPNRPNGTTPGTGTTDFSNRQEAIDFFNKPIGSVSQATLANALPSLFRWLGRAAGFITGVPIVGGSIGKWIGNKAMDEIYENFTFQSPVDTRGPIDNLFNPSNNLPNSPIDVVNGGSGYGVLGNLPQPGAVDDGTLGKKYGMPGAVMPAAGQPALYQPSHDNIGFNGRATRLASRLSRQSSTSGGNSGSSKGATLIPTTDDD